MITDKQLAFIKKLAHEREVPLRWRGMVDEVVMGTRYLPAGAASSLIDILKAAPRRTL